MNIFPHRIIRATPDESKFIFDNMLQNQLVYSIMLGTLTKLFVPDNGDFVLVKYLGISRYGIFNKMELSYYVFYYLDGYGLEPTSIPFSECEIERTTTKDGIKLLERLARFGIMWNPVDKKLMPVPIRADVGGKYWYIDDKFHVCQVKDAHTPVHNERHKNGNYFTSYGEALVFLNKLKEMRMELNKRASLNG